MEMRIEKQSLLLEGRRYAIDNLHLLKAAIGSDENSPLSAVYEFLLRWFDESSFITVHTSGSTGAPKELIVSKEKMMQSARLTCEFLDLREGENALLCMDLRYIGAMMVVVRSLVAGLNLIVRAASSHPLSDVEDSLRFAAMVPLQVYNTFQIPEEKDKLQRTKILIIGGGAINAMLETKIQALPGAVYSTYGMTETLSHIALRRLNGPSASSHYRPFSSVRLSLSTENELIIEAPLVCDDVLTTNDMAHIYPDGSFKILGRKDNVINSGGVKVQAEEIEKILHPFISTPFVITSVPDERLGQAITLLIECQTEPPQVKEQTQRVLPRYHRPLYIRRVDEIPLTENGKIDRVACRTLAQKKVLSEEL